MLKVTKSQNYLKNFEKNCSSNKENLQWGNFIKGSFLSCLVTALQTCSLQITAWCSIGSAKQNYRYAMQ